MKVEQERRPPVIPHARQFGAERLMIRPMDYINAPLKFVGSDRVLPDLAKTGQAPRHEPEAASRSPVGKGMGDRPPPLLSRNHGPVDIVARPIEVDHRARRLCHQDSRTGQPGDLLPQQVGVAILETQPRALPAAHRFAKFLGIAAAGVGHADKHRQRTRSRAGKTEGGAPSPRYAASPVIGTMGSGRVGMGVHRAVLPGSGNHVNPLVQEGTLARIGRIC